MARTWIFQCNPDEFDLVGYLDAAQGPITWLISQYAREITLGDKVFLWQAIGSGDREASGVLAEARVASEVRTMRDDPASRPFWRIPFDEGEAPRVWLELRRVANKKQVLKRDWLQADPILAASRILRLRTGTNFPLTEAEAKRLRELWSRTGMDFTRADLVAALWAYDKTYSHEFPAERELRSMLSREKRGGRTPASTTS